MNQAAKDDEVKKEEGRAVDSKKFTVQKLKAMAEYKMVYCDMAQENICLRVRAAASSGTARLSGTQKLHQEFRLARELRTVRPARPRPPVTMAGAQPLRNQGRKRTRDTEAPDETSDGAKRQQFTAPRGRGGRGGGRGRGNRGGGGGGTNTFAPRSYGSQGNGNGSGSVNGFGNRGNGGNGSNINIRGNGSGNRGNGRRGQTQPAGSPFQQQQQHQQQNFQLPPSMQQALMNSLPPAFLQQYAAANTEWNGGSKDNPVNLEDNNQY
jgi:hypothetical protein